MTAKFTKTNTKLIKHSLYEIHHNSKIASISRGFFVFIPTANSLVASSRMLLTPFINRRMITA